MHYVLYTIKNKILNKKELIKRFVCT